MRGEPEKLATSGRLSSWLTKVEGAVRQQTFAPSAPWQTEVVPEVCLRALRSALADLRAPRKGMVIKGLPIMATRRRFVMATM